MVKNPSPNAGDIRNAGSIPELGRSSLEEEMATHSSILSWRIPWTEEPCGLQSMGSQRLRHDGAHMQDLQEGFMSVVSLLPGAKLGELL